MSEQKEIRGVDVLLKKNGTVIAGQRELTLSIKADKIDTSTKTNAGWKTSLAGLREWSVSLDCVTYFGDEAAAQRAIRQAAVEGTNIDVVVAVGEEEVYAGEASITGLDISGPMSDVSMSSFSLEGASALSCEYAPEYASHTLDEAKKVVTITMSETVLSNAADAAALKAAVTVATNGTTFAALGASDAVAVADGKLVVTFNAALTTATNKIKIAADTLKSTNGAIQTAEQVTDAIDAS